MRVVKNSFVGSRIFDIIQKIERLSLSHCFTNIYRDFTILEFECSSGSFYYDVDKKMLYSFNDDAYINSLTNDKQLINYTKDLQIYCDWLKNRERLQIT